MASFWGELKRRHVVKVAMAYAIVGWLPAVSFVSTSSMADEYDDVVIADAHIHLVGFLQNGDYLENGEIVKKVPGSRGKSPWGKVVLNITEATFRCVMTTLPQGDLPRDPGILRAAAQITTSKLVSMLKYNGEAQSAEGTQLKSSKGSLPATLIKSLEQPDVELSINNNDCPWPTPVCHDIVFPVV